MITSLHVLMISFQSRVHIFNRNVFTFIQTLSDESHYLGSEHNAAYDHEAFLGEEAKTFDQLTPDESKSKLSAIVDKMDTDKDESVSFEELRSWIHKAQKNYILDDVDRQWKSHNPDALEKVSWADYRRITYGFIEELADNSVDEDSKTYKDMMRRDRRRWELADENADDHLSRDEFINFLHPEESEHMRTVVVEETLEDIDKNGDGQISLEEYISDMYAPDASGDQVPDWVTREREQFANYRDKNGDGVMDKNEIREWIIPQDYDHSDAEAKHLIHESDKNKVSVGR